MRHLIATILTTLAAIALIPMGVAHAEPEPVDAAVAPVSIAGTWQGDVNVMGEMLRIIVKVSETNDPAAPSATISIPAQSVADYPLEKVSLDDRVFNFAMTAFGAEWSVTISDDAQSAEGTLHQGGFDFQTQLKRLAADEVIDTGINRPQTPKPPFPYQTREAEFRSRADNANLAATICLPEGEGPFPVVVFITGSGAQDRDETLFNHKPFLVLADDLARHGIASLRYDDRGVGGSEGDLNQATIETFKGDVLGAIDHLKQLPEIDAAHIGLIGHSEGGIVAPAVAAESSDVAFIVMLAGTGVTGEEVLKVQVRAILEASGTDAPTIARQLAEQKKTFELLRDPDRLDDLTEHIRASIRRSAPQLDDASIEQITQAQTAMVTSPWFASFMGHDPRPALRKVTCPVLAINGGKDVQVVPSQNLPEIRAALEAAGNKDVTIRELPGLNHLFQQADTGAMTEYNTIEQTMDPRVVKMVREWVRGRVGLAAE